MRGPLFSGAVGSPATLERLAALAAAAPGPVVVLSTVWLAETLAAVAPILLVVEAHGQRAALRARRRADRNGHRLQVMVAGEELPLAFSRLGLLVVDALAELEDDDVGPFVAALGPFLAPGGMLLAIDATREVTVEARIAGLFLAAGLRDVGQERPREGALLTVGVAPPANRAGGLG